ncbi:tetratricopeptide repeat protein [Streptomyces anulatus]
MNHAPGPWTTHAAETRNSISGGTVHGPVVQANNITGLTFTTAAAPEPPPSPRQLPLPPAWWVDRDPDLTLLQRRAFSPGAVGIRVIALHGPPGSGTTALAARFLHGLHHHHPGGQLYVDMRGGEPGGPLPARRALGQLLRSVRPGPPPVDPQERASWWRSVTAARAPMCLLLDNAVHAADVRACLPAGSGHLVLITSRSPLVELGADGAFFHQVGPLPPDAAHRYLAVRAGEERLRAEPRAAGQLIHLAAGLPAALSLTAAQLSLHPQRALSGLVQALTGNRHTAPARPDHHHPGAIMTTHLDAAYAGLDPDTARACRDLSRLPVHDIDATLVAAVRRITPEEATGHLAALAAVALLENLGSDELRGAIYRFASPELRERALGLAHGHETDGERHDALGRSLGWALSAAATADELVTPSHYRTLGISPGDLPHVPQHPVQHHDADSALRWLTAQGDNLLALIRAASQNSRDDYVWRLVYSMWPWWRAAHRGDEWIELHELALSAASRDPGADELVERHLMNTYGSGLRNAGDPIALQVFTRVWEMACQAGDARGEAQALYELGATHLGNDDAMEAVPLLERARRIRVEHGYGRGVALADILLGQADLHLARVDQALHRFQGARAALLGVDAHDAARALAWQGRTHLKAGDVPAGEAALKTARDEFLAARSPHQAGQALEWAGNAAAEGGRLTNARIFYDQALTHYLPVDAADADRVRDALGRLA